MPTQRLASDIAAAVSSVVVGKAAQIRLLLIALLAEGHVLVDDVPGVAKTLLVRTLAAALGLGFARVQSTPDLLPGDVTGSLVFDQRSADFSFRPGPIFANLVLVDEINRATPRTQAAFLEAMEERTVSVEGVDHPLPRPFLVLATQNPVELKGTFPLPEAQLDRFLLRMRMGYPDERDEVAMLERFRGDDPLERVAPVAGVDDVLTGRDATRAVFVAPDVEAYIVALVRSTRVADDVQLGASPRAALALMRAAQAAALLAGRDFVTPDDVRGLVVPVLAHRLVLSREATLQRRSPDDVVESLAGEVPAPVESAGDAGGRALARAPAAAPGPAGPTEPSPEPADEPAGAAGSSALGR
ncbi:MAG TPA: AAA family ATPase [Thermoleophilia bacterium]|nr:AAA family ATPase [Thermoleophilia bacterium]